MKVLGLSCGRKMGNSEILVREALNEAEEHGAEVEIIRLGDLTIKPCTGCEGCTSNRIKGGEGQCIQKNDHMPFLLNKLAESDGIILGAPAYNLMPPGLLIMIMNRSLGSGKDYREKVAKNPKVGGVITVGGTDWVNLVLPLTNLSLFRLLRGNIKIVDQMLVPYIPRPGQVLLHDDAITRAGRIGHNVVEALNMPYSEVEFQSGEEAETCPLCHNNLLKVKGKFVECPICDIKGTIETRGRKVMVIFEEKALRKSRYGTWGTKRHDDAVAKGHKEYYDRKPDVDEKLKKYKSHKRTTTPPPLKKS